jgi:hypothetical protein
MISGHGQYSVLDMIDRLLTTKSVARTESAINEPTLDEELALYSADQKCVARHSKRSIL